MPYQHLYPLRDEVIAIRARRTPEDFEKFGRAFDIEYAHDSTAIEGNTLSLIETKLVLEDGMSVGGKSLREIFEVRNHEAAFEYVKKCVSAHKSLDEAAVKDIHALLMSNILTGGIYRNVAVRITGAAHKPPPPSEMFRQIKDFYGSLTEKKMLFDTITFAAFTHAEFVKIHPFEDGNGRTARLIMNYQLMSDGFLPVSVKAKDRLSYYEKLESYAVDDNIAPFADFIAALEETTLRDFLSFSKEL